MYCLICQPHTISALVIFILKKMASNYQLFFLITSDQDVLIYQNASSILLLHQSQLKTLWRAVRRVLPRQGLFELKNSEFTF